MPFLQRNARARPLCARLAVATRGPEPVSLQPNHRGARRVFQDGREELSQVKPWAPAPPQPLLQPENSVRQEAFGRRSKRTTFSAPSRLILSFWRGFGKPAEAASSLAKTNETVPYNLYRSRFLCRCAFMRLRRLCLAIFAFLRFLSEPIQILVTAIRLNHLIHHSASVVAGFDYLVPCDGPDAAFFLSCVAMPIFFKNGSIDCLRPRNFSIDSLTSRESPGS
jgi:hypothetical protein